MFSNSTFAAAPIRYDIICFFSSSTHFWKCSNRPNFEWLSRNWVEPVYASGECIILNMKNNKWNIFPRRKKYFIKAKEITKGKQEDSYFPCKRSITCLLFTFVAGNLAEIMCTPVQRTARLAENLKYIEKTVEVIWFWGNQKLVVFMTLITGQR